MKLQKIVGILGTPELNQIGSPIVNRFREGFVSQSTAKILMPLNTQKKREREKKSPWRLI